MTTVMYQIQNVDNLICRNISAYMSNRDLLSQNLLSQLRNLIEGVSVLFHKDSLSAEFNYPAIEPAIKFVKSKSDLNFIGRFHKLLQISASHYTLDGDNSERLMLKYYEYLYRIKSLIYKKYNFNILNNLELFPVDLDPSLTAYHEMIAGRVKGAYQTNSENISFGRYYIHKIKPFFLGGEVYYEVIFLRAINKVNKFDRLIAFTNIDMTEKYASTLTLQRESINVLGKDMPITIIRGWEVSIRPCEFNNYGYLIGRDLKVRTNSPEYYNLMRWLTQNSTNLLDLIGMEDSDYQVIRNHCTSSLTTSPQIFSMLDYVRIFYRGNNSGSRVLIYLMLRMNNQILKSQYGFHKCSLLTGLNISFSCIPFDTMPFCTSLAGHNPKYWDLVESIEQKGREHELMIRKIKNNVERHSLLYTPLSDLSEFKNIELLKNSYNRRIYSKHYEKREMVIENDHAFINGYEKDTLSIINNLRQYSNSGIQGYSNAVERWVKESTRIIDDEVKFTALKGLFECSKVALIYGAAGTGKSTMVDHVANYFGSNSKLFLAHTNPAIDNLKRKVSAHQNSIFRTINSHKYKGKENIEYDLLIIDECSTVSNSDFLNVIKNTKYKLLLLVGDVFQIESIEFGNWFSVIPSFIPQTSVFELTTPFRTKNISLLSFWNKVRKIDDDIAEVISRNQYSSVLNSSLFESLGRDEIILCLNYDGLYGINNINLFLQASNVGKSVVWKDTAYKVGDPILFSDSERFKKVVYNNLKGWIDDIFFSKGEIQFQVILDRPLTSFDVIGTELTWIRDSVVRFSVYDYGYEASDNDDDDLNMTVPFQVAYAVSIHKAQGLEYDSVKIVITDANEDDITHSIFYTAITRARDSLKIFWTPETQQSVLSKLNRQSNKKDIALLSIRGNLI
ncbi:helicase [Shewanella baltica BA175]|uniref:ATP-dependent DNA helicase n=1 Tax=Shewanella baltica TaxID=62322 RepID=UPI0001E4C379|nr:ATP-dependent RecD-like DNA helicase [Shewanella baltica]AEG10274.1 helicase [Shewanella baltica BA175]